MWITRYRIEGFSSFKDSGWIDLAPQFNLFIGQNNSGKSALLKALQAPLIENRHKSLTAFRGADVTDSLISVDLTVGRDELFRRMSQIGVAPAFPALDGNNPHLLARALEDEGDLNLEFELRPANQFQPRSGSSISDLRFPMNQVVLNVEKRDAGYQGVSRAQGPDNLWRITSQDAGSIFFFEAQRLNLARSSLDSPRRLNSNAANLPAVLAHLQGARKPVFDQIERHLMDVLPGVGRLTVVPAGNMFEILIWPDRDARYEELAFNLDASGTGVGQLLAILTAVVTSDQSIIIVDEINSFLHPAAVKKLLSILRSDYGHHQYIISTHSSDTISGCNAERIYIVRRDGFESSVKRVSLNEASDVREIAGNLGFSMMDVFGHDRLIWVEGPTEEQCLPFIARREDLIKIVGLGFASVSATDGFVGKKSGRKSSIDLYYQAGKRLAPLLKGMAFGLDREGLSDSEALAAERSKRKLKLLPRRCIECFFLHPYSIAKILSELDTVSHSTEEVEGLLISIAGEQAYKAPGKWSGNIKSLDWLKRVDAASLLGKIFDELSESRVSFQKTRDSVSLLISIYETDRDHLKDLIDYTEKLVEVAMRDSAI